MVEQRTKSLNHAQTILDDIRARSIYDYDTSYDTKDQDLGNSYLCTIWDTSQGPYLREISVITGYDKNNDGALQSGETLVTLDTLIAQRW